jgi:D-glycero-D-manno-heptose 1,7-bisphosphate phosphatase
LNKELIILDRDGCINEKIQGQQYIYELEKFFVPEDVVTFVRACFNRGYQLAVATNQQGVSKQIYSIKDVVKLHEELLRKIDIENLDFPIFICPHSEESKCYCRKPNPGLLENALDYFKVDNQKAIFIGDSLSDYLAAQEIEMDFIYLDRLSEYTFSCPEHITNLSVDLMEYL